MMMHNNVVGVSWWSIIILIMNDGLDGVWQSWYNKYVWWMCNDHDVWLVFYEIIINIHLIIMMMYNDNDVQWSWWCMMMMYDDYDGISGAYDDRDIASVWWSWWCMMIVMMVIMLMFDNWDVSWLWRWSW